MNLLFLSTAFPQPGDPARAPYNLRLCEALAEQHDVRVISPVPWTRIRRAQPHVGALSSVHYPTFVYPPGMLHATHAWWLWHSIRRTADALIRERMPDAVISYWTWPDGAAAARLARSCGAPVIMTVGGSDILVLSTRAGYRRRVARTLAQASAVVVVSDQLRRAVTALAVPPDRITVVRRGVDPVLFSPGARGAVRQRLGVSHAERVLLWVGRLTPVKGPDLLLDALERLVSEGVQGWRCVLVGDGPLHGALSRRVRGGALRDRVAFTGTLAPPDLADWYRAADALVVSSRSEGMPNVLYEAKACGTPVIASDVGDVARSLDEDDWLVPAGDPARLAVAIRKVLASPSRKRTARTLATWTDSARAFTEVIVRAAARSRGAAA